MDTGNPNFVIKKTAIAAEIATVNAPPIALTDPNLPKVCVAPAPLITAPNITKTEPIIAAVLKRIMRVATAVPKTLAASLAPNYHPKKIPLDNKKRERNINYILLFIAYTDIRSHIDSASSDSETIFSTKSLA